MSPVTESPFLQALGYAIINSLWQFALLWLIYVTLNTIVKLTAHQKYTAGLLVQIAGFSWFTLTFYYYLQQFLQVEEVYFLRQEQLTLAINSGNSFSLAERFFAAITKTESVVPYLSIAYLLILVVLCVKWIRVYRVTQVIKLKGRHKIDAEWRLFVTRISRQLGIKREVRIYLSEMVKTPLTIGFLKPLILIPLANLNHLNTYQMEAIIIHELAHIKRFDYLFNLFLALIDIILFFNPFAILISGHIKRERENCCDDWVLQYEYNASSYADALLQIAISQPSSFLALPAVDNKQMLFTRIKRMIEKKESSLFNYRHQLMALLVMLTVLSSLTLLSALHNRNKSASASAIQFTGRPAADIINYPLFSPDISISSDKEKKNKDEKYTAPKNPNKTYQSTKILDEKITSLATANNLFKQKKSKYCVIKTQKPKVVSPPNVPDSPYEFNTEELVKNPEVSTPEMITVTTGPEQQDMTLEEQLNKVITYLVKQNKVTIKPKELLAIKAAVDQLKKLKIKVSSNQVMPLQEKERSNSAPDQLIIDHVLTPNARRDFQRMAEKLRSNEKEFKKQVEIVNRKITIFKNECQLPKIICAAPFTEEPHSFSFEFSTDSRSRFVNPLTLSKSRNTNNPFLKNENKNPAFQNTLPPASKHRIEKGGKEGENLLTIRI